MRIIGKRRTSKGVEYKVCWKSTWKPTSELEKAQRVVQEFKERRRAQRGEKRVRRARTGKVG